MTVDLGKEVLEGIVVDGIKDMISQIAGRSGTVKKRSWFTEVKAVINEYKKKVIEEFLPVLVKDFGSKTVVRFSGSKMSQDDINKIKMFMEMLQKSNLKKIEKDTLENIDTVKVFENGVEMTEKLDDLRRVFVEKHKEILGRLELHVRQVVSDSMFKKTVERSRIEVMLYNFVEGEVPEDVKKLFENGMDSVPSTRLSKKEVDSRVDEALLEYLFRLGKRRVWGNAIMPALNLYVNIHCMASRNKQIFNENQLFIGTLFKFE